MGTILSFFRPTIIDFLTGLPLICSVTLLSTLIFILLAYRKKIIDSLKEFVLKSKKAVPEGFVWFRDENPDTIGHFLACLPQKSLLLTIYCVAFASTISISFQMPGIIFLAIACLYVLLNLAFVQSAFLSVIGLFSTATIYLCATGEYDAAIFGAAVITSIIIVSFGVKVIFRWIIIFAQKRLRYFMPQLLV